MTQKRFTIIGSGLIESILAGVGTVILLDQEKSYGGEYTCKTLKELLLEYNNEDNDVSLDTELVKSLLLKFKNDQIPMKSGVVYSSGPVVQLIINSGVGEGVLEFQLVKDLLFSYISDSTAEKFPSGKQDVFNSKISLPEKRRLVKFFTSCMENNEEIQNIGFVDHLKAIGLSSKFVTVISTCLSFNLSQKNILSMTLREGIQAVKQYLESLGKFGKGSLLSAIYGTGSEFSQAFCRYGAVYGATFILDCKIHSILEDTDDSKRMNYCVSTEMGDFVSDYLLLSASYTYNSSFPCSDKITKLRVHNYLLIGSEPFLQDLEHALQIVIPNAEFGVYLLQYTNDTKHCPTDTYILHLWSPCESSLKKVRERYLNIPSICINYETTDYIVETTNANNVIVLPSSGWDVTCDDAVLKARDIFERIAPGEVFYPPKLRVEDDDDL